MTDEDTAVNQADTVEEGQAEQSADETELSKDEALMAKLKEAITVDKEEIGPLRLKLTITVPRETMDDRLGEQYLELKRDSTVPGFRKGHAPIELIEKRFRSDVGSDLLSQLVSRGYLAAVEKEDLKPLGDPMIWATVSEEREDDAGVSQTVETDKLLPVDRAIEHMTLPKEQALTFSCELELKPDFELPELDKIAIERPTFKVEKKHVDQELDRIRMSAGTFQPVEEGKTQTDDMLYADMTMSVDGAVIAREDNFDLAVRDLRVKGVPLVGFGDAAKDKNIDDEVSFEAEVPDDHENIDIRGKKAQFAFTIREIKRLVLPPIDETFLQNSGFENEKELRDAVKTQLESQVASSVNSAMREQVGTYLVEKTELDIPEGLSQRQTDRSISRRTMEMYRANVPQAEIDKAVDRMRVHAHDRAVRDLKLFFILEKIGEDREVDIREDEINGAIAAIAQRQNRRFDRVRDDLSKGDGLMSLYLQLRDEKIFDSLIESAEIKDAESPKKESAPDKAAKKKTAKKTVKKKKTPKSS